MCVCRENVSRKEKKWQKTEEKWQKAEFMREGGKDGKNCKVERLGMGV